MKYLLRIRSWEGESWQTAWLLRRDGAAESLLLYGNLPPGRVEEVVALVAPLGLEVHREHCPLPTPPGTTPPMPKEATLFDQGAET